MEGLREKEGREEGKKEVNERGSKKDRKERM